MNWLGMVLIGAGFAAVSLRAAAEPACTEVVVLSSVAAAGEKLTLADLLERNTCPQLRDAAAQVSLGIVPRGGRMRVLDGRPIRGLLDQLAGAGLSLGQIAAMQVPERITVRRTGKEKSCAEIARFVAAAALSHGVEDAPTRWLENLDCAAARGIPEATPLQLTKTVWNTALQRWEFSLLCLRPEDCVPFLVWTGPTKTPADGIAKSQAGMTGGLGPSAGSSPVSFSRLPATAGSAELLVKRGQTATLTWDQAGIRIVLPVTCLDAGGLGQFVRVRFMNTPRILRAEVVGEGMLRATL